MLFNSSNENQPIPDEILKPKYASFQMQGTLQIYSGFFHWNMSAKLIGLS